MSTNARPRLLAAAATLSIGCTTVAASSAGAQQDSVIWIRGSSPGSVRPTPPRETAPRRDLPDFLTPSECDRLVRYRDGDLARIARTQVTVAEVSADAAVDLAGFRRDLERTYSVSEWIAARDAVKYVADQTVATVRAAMSLATALARPDGAPKTVGELVRDLAKKGAEEAKDAVVKGKTDEYRRRINEAAADLDAALKRFALEATNASQIQNVERGRQETRALVQTRLPEIDAAITRYRAAVRDANAQLRSVNDELAAVDATLRQACR